MRTVVAFALLVAAVDAHGGLTFPPPRNNYGNADPVTDPFVSVVHGGPHCGGGECLWFNEGCWIGCETCTRKEPEGGNYWNEPECTDGQLMSPTLPEEFRTWNIGNPSNGDWTKYHPWRAPGYAPTVDPCGVAGAYLIGDEVPPGSQRGALGSKLPKLGVKTEWTAGGVAEAGWMVGTNHGGGYVYSLCPANETLTEECFERTTLAFAGDRHTIRYLDNGTQFDIPAVEVSVGTWPQGSAWRRNPIPACNCDQGWNCTLEEGTMASAYADEPRPEPAHLTGNTCETGTQFPVPFDYGYGDKFHFIEYKEDSPDRFMWAIVDQLKVPDVLEGEYVLRWRWDCEQTPQVWSHCADVTIKAAAQTPKPMVVV